MPNADLKLRLTLRIAAVSLVCLAAAAAYVLFDADRTARDRMAATAEIAAKGLVLQQDKLAWVKAQPMLFPDLQLVATPFMEPGLCIGYREDGSTNQQRFCGGSQSGTEPPAVFAALYHAVFDPEREVARPVVFRGQTLGEVVVSTDPVTLTAAAWQAVSHLLAIMGVTLLLLCALVYFALARALRPTRIIRAGLERIAAHDLSARLPPFDLAELSAIRTVFNDLAANLERTLRERDDLTRKLIALQDDERRHLARELHDEFGQSLAAIRALAASIGQTAAQDCPALLPESESIARTARQMMETLRGALFRLRPPDVDELGLIASLEGLVAGWNGWSGGRTRFEIRFAGALDALPAAIGANLYRIAQEAITNAAKHAEATRVTLDLALQPTSVAMTVQNDGRVAAHDPAVRPGMGFLGMRERVTALGGTMAFEPHGNGDMVLRIAIPVVPQGSTQERAA